jgi:hypothetical protein
MPAESLQRIRTKAPKVRFLSGLAISKRDRRRVRRHRKARAYARLFLLAAHLSSPTPVAAQDGRHGHDHHKWHGEFYSKLMRPDTKTSCCNLSDCRPTEVRSVGDHQEIKKDGRWIRLPQDKVVKVTAPDGGAHICAPPSQGSIWDEDFVFCVIMPPEI